MRITHNFMINRMLRDLNNNLKKLLKVQEQMSTFRRVLKPSDDPIQANSAMRYDRTKKNTEQYNDNIESAKSFLGLTDATLDDLHDLINRAKQLALSEVDSGSDEQSRAAASLELEEIIRQVVAIANKKFGNRYLFGGTQTETTPFEWAGNGVIYHGNDEYFTLQIAGGDYMNINLTGDDAFGGMATVIDNKSDLNPNVTWDTKLSSLNNGNGVPDGSIKIVYNGNTYIIDLSDADTLEDVEDMIENAVGGPGVLNVQINAAKNGLYIQNTGGGVFSITEVANNNVAASLGILKTSLNTSDVNGTDIDPIITDQTPLSELNSAAGNPLFDLTSGFTITNGDYSATIDTSSLTTVEDLKNAIKRSGTYTELQITEDGRGFKIVSKLSGSGLRIEENGGTTAEDLGILSFTEMTKLEDLNNGLGVQLGKIYISYTDAIAGATQVEVDLSNASRISDVITGIQNATANTSYPNGQLTVELINGNALRITDNNLGTFTISSEDAKRTAEDLGIAGSSVGNVLTGSDVNPQVREENLFSALLALKNGIDTNNTALISKAGQWIDNARDQILNARAIAGSRSIRLEMTQDRNYDENINVTTLYSEIVDLNIADAVLEFQKVQNIYESSLRTSAQISRLSLLDYL